MGYAESDSLLICVNTQAITKHFKNIYSEGELSLKATCSKMEQIRYEGGRRVTRKIDFYNLDAIISVGYRVNSRQATQFRIWATSVIKQYMRELPRLRTEFLKSELPASTTTAPGCEIRRRSVLHDVHRRISSGCSIPTVLLLSPRLPKDSETFLQDVQCGIPVPVHMAAAVAVHHPVLQVLHLMMDLAAAVAYLA